MNRAEYEKLSRQARRSTTKISRKAMMKVQKVYDELADELAKIVESLSVDTLSLEFETNVKLANALDEAREKLANALYDNTQDAVEITAKNISNVNRKFLVDNGFQEAQIVNIMNTVNEDAVLLFANRVWQDGYTFSQRVWREGPKYQDDIKNLLSSGIAQGRDPFQIAKDIQVYTQDGKVALMKRYGKLKRGTREFTARIPKNIDYRAVRLVRTEIYNTMRDVQVSSGEANPGVTGEYNWIRQSGAGDFNCACPDLAAGSPYTADNIPINPHPNCSCRIQPVLRDQNEFVADLKKWLDGENVDYLDSWASRYGYSK